MKNRFQNFFRIILPLAATVLTLVLVLISLMDYEKPDFSYLIKDKVVGAIRPEVEKKAAEENSGEGAASDNSIEVEDGLYEGSGMGYKGVIRVSLLVKGGKITSIDILENHDDASFFNRAVALIDDIIEKQSWDVDVVTGATYSSKGIKNAVENAITGKADNNLPISKSSKVKAVKKIKEEKTYKYKDGLYEGTGTGFAGDIKVSVKIKKGKIKKISILEHSDGPEYIKKARSVIKQIIKKQTTNVDVATGATYSSNGIIVAVRDALDKAKTKKDSGSEGKDSNSDKDNKDSKDGNSKDGNSDEGNNKAENDGDDNDKDGSDVDNKDRKFPYLDGIYQGIGEGFKGKVKVAVEIKDGSITSINILESNDDEAFMKKASALLKDIVAKQDINVDTVSGATFSSKGLLEAVANSIKEAERTSNASGGDAAEDNTDNSVENNELVAGKKDTEEKDSEETDSNESNSIENGSSVSGNEEKEETKYKYNDGDYVGTAQCIPDEYEDFEPYNIVINFSLKNDRIVSISSILADYENGTNDVYLNWAINGRGSSTGLKSQLTSLNNLSNLSKVDVVTYATCSSKSIKAACEDGLNKAKKEKKADE